MKSAYELAMERLNKASPTVKLTEAQKKQLAELDSKYAAKIAEREISLKDEITKAATSGEFEKGQQMEQQLLHDRKKLQAELEEKKEALRAEKPLSDRSRRFQSSLPQVEVIESHNDQ